MTKKKDFNEVYNYFKTQGCELLEHEYINNNTKMKYICKCGNESSITWNHFLHGRRCAKCGGVETKNITDLKNIFLKEGCELLVDSYKNAHTKMKYKCSCGNISEISWTKFSQGKRCNTCGRQKTINSLKEDYKVVYKYFIDNDCELLEDNYINNRVLMKYRCSCGNISYTRYDHFKNGHRCDKCNQSSGERKIEMYLLSNNISYIPQYKFDDLRNINKLRFDFAIFDNKLNLLKLIEFDGKQHFEPIDFFGGEESFKETQLRDRIKNEYCHSKNIHLLRIPYWEFDNIEIILSENLKIS